MATKKTENRPDCPGYGYRRRRTYEGYSGHMVTAGCKFKASPERDDGLCKVCGRQSDQAARYKRLSEAVDAARVEARELAEALGTLLGVEFNVPRFYNAPTTIDLPFAEARKLIERLSNPQR